MLRSFASKTLALLAITVLGGLAAQNPAAQSFETTPAEGCDVLVVKKGTSEPVSGAIVSFIDISKITTEEALTWFEDSSVAATHARLGRRFKTDEHGRTRVPFPTERAALRATSGDLVGQRTIEVWSPEQRMPFRVEVERDLVQRVKVIDAIGRPRAQVPIALSVKHGSQRAVFVSATTGLDGIAELAHMQRVLEDKSNFADPRIELGFVSQPAANPGIRFSALSSEPPTLVLPDAGSLRLHARGPHGGRLSGPVHAYFTVLPIPEDGPTQGSDVSLSIDADGVGSARFGFVGVGLKMQVLAFPGNASTPDVGNQHFAMREIVGPKRAGEEVVVDLDFETFEPAAAGGSGSLASSTEGTVLVTGIVLGPDGQPAPRAMVGYVEREGSGGGPTPWSESLAVQAVETRDDGSFVLREQRTAGLEGAAAKPVDIRACVALAGCVPPLPVSFVRGAKLEIRLAQAALVCGTLITDADALLEGLQITLAYATPNEHTRWLQDRRHGPGEGPGYARFGLGSRFEWGGLAAGRVTVRIGLWNAPAPLVEVAGIDVAAGAIVHDPRLKDIDLRGKLPRAR